uniref:hypothetical protein n=1 Tax=Pseudonocardia sp. CA-138482 TaxID=3240023 RepID=UPI003F4983F4
MMSSSLLYTVHAVHPYGLGPFRMIWEGEAAARNQASLLSREPGVLAAVITEYVMRTVEWTPFALYIDGTRRRVPPAPFPFDPGSSEAAAELARRRRPRGRCTDQ